MKFKPYPRRGQSLIEVVVVVGVVILLVTGLIVGTTFSLKNVRVGKAKSAAVKYAQEGAEVTRTLRNASWSSFQTKSGAWCLDGGNAWTPAVGNSCPTNLAGGFSRKVDFVWNLALARMEVTVTVTWSEGSTTHTSQIITYFTQWQ